jgi:hypothetical protein
MAKKDKENEKNETVTEQTVENSNTEQTVVTPNTETGTSGWEDAIASIPTSNVKGKGSSEENRCTPDEVEQVVRQTGVTFGIAKNTAACAIAELIRRGGANASTPDNFSIEIVCPEQKVIASIEKREIARIVSRVNTGKTLRNLAEGMAESIVKAGIKIIKKDPSVDRSGDLAKKLSNRLSFKNQPGLTPEEKVGCASYAQWLPNLNELCSSNRLKQLLAEDLELRKSGRIKGQLNKKQEKNPPKKGKGKGGK